MKKAKILNVLALLLFILGIVGLVLSLSFTKEYKGKIAFLEQQNNTLVNKLDDLKASLDDFRFSLDSIKTDSTANVNDISIKMSALESDKKEIMAKITSLTKDIQDLQKNYAVSISGLKAAIDTLKNVQGVAAPQTGTKVNLGEISVQQQKQQK